jgi:hypothetical protein
MPLFNTEFNLASLAREGVIFRLERKADQIIPEAAKKPRIDGYRPLFTHTLYQVNRMYV